VSTNTTPPAVTEIAFILDRSGSMKPHATAAVGEMGIRTPSRAFSRKVRAMREMKGDATDLFSPLDDILRDEEEKK